MPFPVSKQQLGVQLGVFFSYLVTARLGQYFAVLEDSVSPVWLAAGVAFCAGWLFGPRAYLPLFLGTWVFNYNSALNGLGSFVVGAAVVTSVHIALQLCKWIAPDRDFYAHVRRLVFLLAGILPLTAFIPAVTGLTVLLLTGEVSAPDGYLWGMFTWFLGDLMGLYLLVPLVIGWRERRPVRDSRRKVELALVLLGVVAAAFSVFDPPINPGLPLTFLTVPFLLWLATRFDPVWAGVGNLLLAAVAIPETFSGGGPYYLPSSPHRSLVLLDIFLTFSTLFTYLSAAFSISRNRFEEKLIESESRFRKMADNAPILIWLSRAPADRTEFNRCWIEFTGLTAEELVHDRWLSVVHPDDRERCLDVYTQAERERHGFQLEYRLLRRDGVFRWVREQGVPRHVSEATIEGFIGCCSDITDERLTRQQLRHAKEAADRANAAKSDFLATISHEIRTPLTAILGYAEILSTGGRAAELENQKFIRRIQTNAQHLKSLVDDVLDLSKIEAGKIELDLCEFSLSGEIRRIVESLENSARACGTSIHVRIAQNTIDHLISDPTRFRQIVSNVLGNAIKFTPHGSIWLDVSTPKSSSPAPKLVHIVVTDTGVGMTEEQANRVFDPFVQGDSSTTRKFGGTGLGLALSRKLARRLGGDVTIISSEPNRGSSFLVTLSTGVGEETALGTARTSTADTKPGSTLKGQLEGISILVAEDSPELRELIRLSLSLASAEIDFACDGQQAVDKALSKKYDFVFMDLQMPKLDGYRAIQTLRAKGAAVPIVALTARLTSDERGRVAQCGANDCLAKPFHFEDLVRMVRKHVSPGTKPEEQLA